MRVCALACVIGRSGKKNHRSIMRNISAIAHKHSAAIRLSKTVANPAFSLDCCAKISRCPRRIGAAGEEKIEQR